MLNKNNKNGIDFDRLNDLVDNGVNNSDYTDNIGTNENYNSKKNVRPNLYAQQSPKEDASNNTPPYYGSSIRDRIYQNMDSSQAPNNTIVGDYENYNSKKNYGDERYNLDSSNGNSYDSHANSGHAAFNSQNEDNSRGEYNSHNSSNVRDNNGGSNGNGRDSRRQGAAQKASNNRLRSMYVINLTSTRMGIVLGVLFSLILLIFIIGFQIGSSKDKGLVANGEVDTSREELLFRSNADKDIINVANANANANANASGHVRTSEPTRSDIVSIDLLSQNNATTTTGGGAMATDDISSMVSRDLEDLGRSLNSGGGSSAQASQSINSVSSTDALMNSYANSQPASYIPGEKNNSSSTFTGGQQPQNTSTTRSQSSSSDLVYYIQVAVTTTEKSANAERDYLRAKSFNKAFVVDGIAKDGSTMYKLKIGRYPTKTQAEEALSTLKSLSSKYSDSYIYPDKAS